MAAATGLPAGLPVFGGIGDNQASFLGSVADRDESLLVNVGTGGQVAMYTERYTFDPLLETRPFPRGGYLLVSAGLSGGAAYAVLERFYRDLGTQLFGITSQTALYTTMNRLAGSAQPGADGLRCEPFFSGTRLRPEIRASWTGVSAENFTPRNMIRALLEGISRALRSGRDLMAPHRSRPCTRLVGAGNGLRENPQLASMLAEEFSMPVVFPVHREEAAFGAALMAGVAAGCWCDLSTAAKQIRYVAGSPPN
jgi:sugar (pentulose or hexulose) kinase